MPACDLRLLRWGGWQLLILHFRLGHVVVARVKVLLLHKDIKDVRKTGSEILLDIWLKTFAYKTYPLLQSFPEKV